MGQGSGVRDQGSGIRGQGSGIRDQGSGIRALAFGLLDWMARESQVFLGTARRLRFAVSRLCAREEARGLGHGASGGLPRKPVDAFAMYTQYGYSKGG